MSMTKDYLFGRKKGQGLGNWKDDEPDESVNFLGELCNEEPRNIDIDDELYENYKEQERMVEDGLD